MARPIPIATHRSRRWRLAFGLRGLMLLVLAIGLPMGWKARRASLQRRAVEKIERVGGRVEYDWQRDWVPGPASPRMPDRPVRPRWVIGLLGDEYFQEIVGVVIPRDPLRWVNDIEEKAEAKREIERALKAIAIADQLACLDGLDRLESLDLDLDELTPEGLDRLGRLDGLKSLRINKVDARVAATLGRLTRLEELIVNARVRPVGPACEVECDSFSLAFLDRMPRLRELALNMKGSGFDGPALRSIRGLSKLKRLELCLWGEPIAGDQFVDLIQERPGLVLVRW